MLIGLTGGIGSGKTTIAKELERRGYAVYYSDGEAKRIITGNPAVRSQIEYIFGSDVFNGDVYRTNIVAKAVFQNPTLLQKLNHIVHPAVRFDVKHWAKEKDLCFVESALLFSSGLAEECDLTVVVTAPEELRIQRVIKRDKSTREQVRERIQAQDAEAQAEYKADLVVVDDEETEITQLVDNMLYNIKTALAQ